MSDSTPTPKMRDHDLSLQNRITRAIERIANGHAPMRVPVEATDPDVVLGDCATEIDRLERECAELRQALADALGKAVQVVAEQTTITAQRDTYKTKLERRKVTERELRAELAKCKQDAERYRLIRANTTLRNRGYGPKGCWLEDGMEGLPWDENLAIYPRQKCHC